ncbi:RNA pseudouridylate synthase domain-containing protein 1-like [Galendromus occidentalis]|uniref:RNA pseudouridylate synthase domain-containing protein 1-like n=1 Tax=Galendromus occidentalis TaxID=34638 RepID=A0AAJ6QNV4_9ACAR|nr:RNA pseudouridylate synthase domain-containing protein 1-like [Galendromus occidentalis]
MTDLKILYRNEDFVVVDKPVDIAINAWDDEKHPVTVASILKGIIPECADPSVKYNFRFVHRLDFSTSGTLCIALNKKAASDLTKSFESRHIDKTYIALLMGRLDKEVTVEKPIGQHRRKPHKMVPNTDPNCVEQTVRDAKTQFTPVRYGFFLDTPVTKVQIKLFTGRRHQIRVHALTLGHPIFGDYTYTGAEEHARMYLHAKKLRIPYRGDTVEVESPIDFDLDTVLEVYS